MASKYTKNYNLCQWEESDKVLRAEFNADNAKIDAALGTLATSVSGKASTSALSSLQSTVNSLQSSKADKSVLDSLSQTVSQHTTSLAGKGNCQLYTSSYTGLGRYGQENAISLTFPQKPIAVFVCLGGTRLSLFQGVTGGYALKARDGDFGVSVSWSGNTVTWYASSNPSGQMNLKNEVYQVFALLDAAS